MKYVTVWTADNLAQLKKWAYKSYKIAEDLPKITWTCEITFWASESHDYKKLNVIRDESKNYQLQIEGADFLGIIDLTKDEINDLFKDLNFYEINPETSEIIIPPNNLKLKI